MKAEQLSNICRKTFFAATNKRSQVVLLNSALSAGINKDNLALEKKDNFKKSPDIETLSGLY